MLTLARKAVAVAILLAMPTHIAIMIPIAPALVAIVTIYALLALAFFRNANVVVTPVMIALRECAGRQHRGA
jgi:hypothetical protein